MARQKISPSTTVGNRAQLGVDAAYAEAVSHFNAECYAEADKLCTAIIKAVPNHIDAINLLGVIAQKINRYDLAVEQFRSAIANNKNIAVLHHNLGVSLFQLKMYNPAVIALKDALELEPDNVQLCRDLGVALTRINKLDAAVAILERAVAINAGFAPGHYALGLALKEQGNLHGAIASYQKTIAINPDFAEAHNNLGSAFAELGELDAAVNSYQKAVASNPGFAEAHSNLGNVFIDQGKHAAAVTSCQQAISINPDFAEAYSNLGNSLSYQGNFDEAVTVWQIALQKDPANNNIANNLIDILDWHTPKVAMKGIHLRAQEALQQISVKHLGRSLITDAAVQQLYRQCQGVLEHHALKLVNNGLQIRRGFTSHFWKNWKKSYFGDCARHKVVFNKFNVIPEYCFNCYKVVIEPVTIVELFKLMLLFASDNFPTPNTRKCMIDNRRDIAGSYKGFIYCQGFAEGQKILKAVQPLIAERVANNISISVKRGCSEFRQTYPDYGRNTEVGTSLMTYKEEWRKFEDETDNNLVGHIHPFMINTYDHLGLTLRDLQVMGGWLAFAAEKKDLSHLQISNTPIK